METHFLQERFLSDPDSLSAPKKGPENWCRVKILEKLFLTQCHLLMFFTFFALHGNC